ncbi:c-type cytochrome [Hydrogenophaga sp. YM1]|uniref:c-type cytochrome n=1 Tax=Hydrogenophaga sp. YM1 TaxID=2806262 RepID=UPI00195EE2CC|nr:c-type cytochrome [Hydrogenophaga sp. YM1]QRR35421.1 c-type cytochrome [Hydrogenophaga sp. YM1]
MSHPRRAARDPLKGATPAARPSRFRGVSGLFALLAFVTVPALAQAQAQAQPWHGLGREATPAEIKAWDIDVRPDFKGLPKGAGSVSLGEQVWEAKCASCHGVFGESNEVFTPLVGGTTKADIERGRVKNLELGSVFPQRTTMMKASTVSTLWDYINRAMPWNAPKSLKTDEVYGVLAYMLSLADVVPADYTLSDENIADVQKRLPNRNGLVFYEPLWKVSGKGDVKNVACMKDCPTEAKVRSALPDFARDAHGNIQEQNRVVGPVRGADTTKPAPTAPVGSAPPPAPVVVAAAPAASGGVDVKALLSSNGCTACHGVSNKIVGPGFTDILARHKGKADLEAYLAAKIKAGGSGVFGAVPMPPQPQLKDAEAQAIARWIAAGPR